MAKGTQKVSKKQRKEAVRQQEKQRNVRYSIIGIVALVLIGGAIWLANRPAPPIDTALLGELSGIQYDGDPDAPIQIVEYGDFSCHACQNWHNSGAKDFIKRQFGQEVAFQFRHFAWGAPTAAAASQCAADQGEFWAYHDYLYEQATPTTMRANHLKEYASNLGLDRAQFDLCLDENKYANFIQEQMADARSTGARGTPTFIINGQTVSAQPEAMIDAIDALLDG